ncbi:hypothetical protein SLS62_003799 [Diatrype stigma]|uniref:AMP-activated protein kinase glycogen-binding domain-containing protein n=1 Tax=Diatrype stigma TaxID=117547 RepID=A0AAN9UVZ7_9PEZI
MTTRVPVRFTYQKDDTVPPVYVAGTFSDPAWQPFEMDVTQNENGQNIFSKVIDVSDASDIQYKFRIGSGNWWLCNENAETITDEQGNINNILRVPSCRSDKTSPESLDSGDTQTSPDLASTASEVADSAALLDRNTPETPDQVGRTDSTPPSESPTGAASEIEPEAPNTSRKLDSDQSAPDIGGAGGHAEPSQPSCPMFSHEYVAFPDEDDKFDDPPEDLQSTLDDYQLRKQSETRQHEYAQDPDIDLDNPTLEKFPSDSASIMATIRRLSTSVNEDRTFPQGAAPSLVVNPFKSSTDDLSDDQSLAVPPADQPRAEGKKSSVSVSAGSVSSLGSIAETDDERPNDERDETPKEGTTPVIQHPAAKGAQPGVENPKVDAQGDGPGSDDEGIAMCNVARQRPAEGNLDRADLLIPEPVGFARLPPSHIVEPILQSSTPLPEEDRIDSAETSANGLAINHVRDASPHIVISSPTDSSDSSNQNTLRKGNADRPISRTSMNSLQDVKGGANWLQVFIHMLLVDWVGGFLSRLWYGRSTA